MPDQPNVIVFFTDYIAMRRIIDISISFDFLFNIPTSLCRNGHNSMVGTITQSSYDRAALSPIYRESIGFRIILEYVAAGISGLRIYVSGVYPSIELIVTAEITLRTFPSCR